MTGSLTTHGYFYKPSYSENGPVAYSLYNSALDATDAELYSIYIDLANLNLLIIDWAPMENQDIFIPGSTYASSTSFTITGDYTSQFVANAKVRFDLGAGALKGSYVVSSSYAALTTTVNIHDSILTNPISGVWVTATRNGLFPYGPGYIVVRDYGVPGQSALSDALSVVGSLDRTIVLTPGTWTISADTTIPSNINLKVEKGAILAISTTKTLTINGTLVAGRYQIFSCTGTGKVILGNGVTEVPPEWWGENTTPGVTDMAPMIQAAIDAHAAYTASPTYLLPVVSLANQRYRLAAALDLTTTYVVGSMQRDGTHIRGTGYGSVGTMLIGDTGNLMLDTCGSDSIDLENLYLTSNAAYAGVAIATPSTVGILQARLTVNPQCQFHTYRNVMIDMHDDITANGGYGTVGIANCQAESVTYDTNFSRANRPAIFTITTAELYGIDSVYQPGGIDTTIVSMGSIKFIGHNNLWTLGRYQPALIWSGVVDFLFSGEITNVTNTGTNDVAISIRSACFNVTVNAVIEALGTVFELKGALLCANCNINSANPLNTSAPVIEVVPSFGYMTESNLLFNLPSSAARDLIHFSAPAGASFFRNTNIKTSQVKANAITTLDATFVDNCTFKNLVIETADEVFNTNARTYDYTDAANVTGFSSFTVKQVFLSIVGDEVTLRFYLKGTSDATDIQLTLPIMSASYPYEQVSLDLKVEDNGTWTGVAGYALINSGSSVATIYKNPAALFTASGEKAAVGTIKYYRQLTY